MADLLKEHVGAIAEPGLKSLAKDWVERLIEHVAWLQERDGRHQYHFHALDWVCCKSCSCHIDGTVDRHSGDQVKYRLVGHAADWERDRTNVELSREDTSTKLLDNVLEGVAILSDHCSVIERETTIFMGIRVPEVILDTVERLPALYHLPDPHTLLLDFLFKSLINRCFLRSNSYGALSFII